MRQQPDDPGLSAYHAMRSNLASSEISAFVAGILTGGTIIALVWVLSILVLK